MSLANQKAAHSTATMHLYAVYTSSIGRCVFTHLIPLMYVVCVVIAFLWGSYCIPNICL